MRREDHESTFAAIRVLLGKPAYRHILVSMVAYFLVAYGAMVFIVSLMIRVHGLNVAQAGATFGVISAIGAVVGNLGGGALADRLARRDLAWIARVGGWGMIAALPLYELALYASTIVIMAPLLVLSTILLWGVVPPMFSALHVVCGSKHGARGEHSIRQGPPKGGSKFLSPSAPIPFGSYQCIPKALAFPDSAVFPPSPLLATKNFLFLNDLPCCKKGSNLLGPPYGAVATPTQLTSVARSGYMHCM